MLRTRRVAGPAAGVAVAGVVFSLLGSAPAHATAILKLDNSQGNSAWSQYRGDRYLDLSFNGSRYLDRVSYNDFGLTWSGRPDPQYFDDEGWGQDEKDKDKKDPVPEPGTLSLFLTALLGTGLFLRARKPQGR